MRKKIGMAAAMVTTVALLAACSSGGTTETSSPEPSETASTPAASGSLTVWVDENRQPAVAAAAETFTAETGAAVELVVKNFEDIRSDFIAQVPTGEGPDITIGAHDWVGALVAAGVVNTVDLGANAAQFSEAALDAVSWDGQLYGMPYAAEAIALIQNVDLVGEEAPATFDEMLEKGKASGAERPFCVNVENGNGYNMFPFQASFGAPIFATDASGNPTTELGMAGDEGLAFASWLGANGEKGTGALSTTISYDINLDLFNSGKCAYTLEGPWALGTLTDVNYVVNPIPSAGGQPATPFVGVQSFYVSAQSANALLANEFLTNYVATPEAMSALYAADPRLPVFEGVDISSAANPAAIEAFQAVAATGTPMPKIDAMGSVWEGWNAGEAKIIQGEDPATQWAAMIEQITAAIGG